MKKMVQRPREMVNGVVLTISLSTISNIYSTHLVDQFGIRVYVPLSYCTNLLLILLHGIYCSTYTIRIFQVYSWES